MNKIIITSAIFLLISINPIQAVDCFSTLSGDQTVSSSCTLKTYTDGNNGSRLVSGIDSGTGTTNSATLTVSSGTMTINSNETLVIGDMDITGGSIAIADGATIEIGKPMWMVDADSDSYPASTAVYVQESAPTNGVRLNTITTNMDVADCNDSSAGVTIASTLYQDSDGDGYGNPSVSSTVCPSSGWVANNTDCNDTGTNSQNVYVSTSCYVDSDGDGYGSTTTKSCANNATCSSATWASDGNGTTASATSLATSNIDCNDSAYSASNSCTVTFQPTNGMDAKSGDTTGTAVFAWDGAFSHQRCYIKFEDLNTTIPSNATITAANMTLYFYDVWFPTSIQPIYVRRITSSWTETGTTESTPTHDSTNYGTFSPGDVGSYTFSISTTLIQNWVNGTWTNYGMALYQINNAAGKWAYSSENGTTSLKPKLVVTYNVQ